ncbi:MAG: HIT family protein [Leptospirales bacterium]
MKSFILHPRLKENTFLIGKFSLSRVLLMNEKRYPWVILVPQKDHLREIFDMGPNDQAMLAEESAFVAQKMDYHFNADKMNIAALGNIVEQLHIHHIVRYKNDSAWPAPVWGKFPPVPYPSGDVPMLIEKLENLFNELLV